MWSCKHCLNEFNYTRTTEKANHSRHCDSNPKKKETYKKIKLVMDQRSNSTLGALKLFEVTCANCQSNFNVKEREKQFPLKEKYFCCRSCANSRQDWWDSENNPLRSQGYRAIASKNHELKCVVCDFDSIVDIHHIDENHKNNDPTNLVCLCPNHHRMYHSNAYKEDITLYIKRYILDKWGIS